MHQDALPQMDDRAIGMIGNSLHYAAGLDTPENKAFVDAFAKKYKRLPSWFSESAYTASLWTRTAIEAIKGNVEDKDAFLKAMRSATIKAPRGTLKMDEYDNPIQNVYMTHIQKINHPVLGAVLTNVPIKTYARTSRSSGPGSRRSSSSADLTSGNRSRERSVAARAAPPAAWRGSLRVPL